MPYEVRDNSQGPILSEDFLNGLMRQSMSIDLSNLMEDLFPKEEALESQELESTSGSVSVSVDKQTARAMARQARIDARKILEELAEQERVSEWVRAIAIWMQQNCSSQAVSKADALRSLLVKTWLALFLGG